MFQIKWLWHNMKGYRKVYILAMALTVVYNIFQLTVPVFCSQLVDIFVSSENAVENLETKRGLFYALLLGMIGVNFLRTVVTYATCMSYEYASQGLIYKVRNYLFKNILNQDMRFYDINRTGDLMTRLTGDLDMVRHALAWIIRAVIECVSLFSAAAIYFFIVDPLMALCILALTPLIFVVTMIFKKTVGPMYVDLRERLSQMNTAAQENISGNRVVKAFAREDYEIEKFRERNLNFSTANKKAALMWLKFFPYIESLAQGLTVVMLLCGGLFLIKGRLTMGEYIAISGLIWTVSNPMRQFGNLINDLQRFLASAQKIVELYYARPTIVDRPEAESLNGERLQGAVTFKDVTFKYGDREVLKNLNFEIKPGETVAIMGETGSGKTSLINLIPRFYDVAQGEVLVDGKNVRMYKLHELRRNIGMATQDVLLYSDTIDGNIAYGDSSMPEDNVKAYAQLAAASEFIEKMPLQYETIIGERGVGLSGGQKQRISLARAMAIRPSILILDDTTSAVDLETEKHIQDSLNSLDFNCTKIIIAQRISSTKDADKIIILENGEITEMGTHKELLQKKGYYYNVFKLQNEGFSKTKEVG